MPKPTPIIIKDNDKIRNILIQLDFEGQKTAVLSNFSAWENLAIIMEALAVTAQKCIDEGISKRKVDEAIKKYLAESLDTYII